MFPYSRGEYRWGQLVKIALERLGAVAVAGVGSVVGHSAALVGAEVAGHFHLQDTPDQHLGRLLEQAVCADQDFRFLVVGELAVSQFDAVGIGLDLLGAFATVIISPCGRQFPVRCPFTQNDLHPYRFDC